MHSARDTVAVWSVWCFATLALSCNAGLPAPPFYPDKQQLLCYTDKNGTQHPVRTRADWSMRRADILASIQLVAGQLPDTSHKCPIDVQVLEEHKTAKFTRKKITFAAEANDRVPAWLLIPSQIHGRAPAMLCLHQTTSIGKDEPAGLGGKENLHYAQELAERGYVALAVDYPNFGEYKFEPYSHGYSSCTMKGIWNHMRAVDVLGSLPEVNKKKIGVIGHSLGGHNALFLAVFDTRIRAVVTSCGFNSFYQYKGGDLTGWSHAGYMPRIATIYGSDPKQMPFDFTEVLAAIAPRPVFINAPLADDNFPIKGVQNCVSAASPVYQLLGAKEALILKSPDCGHDFLPDTRRAAYEWLDRLFR